MPQRNGQNPVRMAKGFSQAHGKFNKPVSEQGKTPGTVQCPECHTDVQPKPGFRTSSLKCPKCGAAKHK